MVLKPNEVAIYNKVEQKLTRKVLENAGDEISWRHGEFIFDDLPLQEIARELPTHSEQRFTLPTQPCKIIGSQRDSVMEKTWMRFYLYCIMPVISYGETEYVFRSVPCTSRTILARCIKNASAVSKTATTYISFKYVCDIPNIPFCPNTISSIRKPI